MTTRILTDYEVDCLVAEQVMGWRRERTPNGNGYYERWYDAEGIAVYSYLVTGQSMLGLRWQPSTNIAHAWQVLEHFAWPKFYTRLARTERGNWRCTIELRGGDGPVVSAYSESAPSAICQCALKAVKA